MSAYNKSNYSGYKHRLLQLFKKCGVVVFFAVRQDLFRWALSIYRGDGTGKKGHLQFKIWDGSLRQEDLPQIRVDRARFERIIKNCRGVIEAKIDLMAEMQAMGIITAPMYYEDFCADKFSYFNRLFDFINIEIPAEEIQSALEKTSRFKKVHSDDISTFVVNHREIEEQFGGWTIDFEKSCRSAIGSHWNDDFYRFTHRA